MSIQQIIVSLPTALVATLSGLVGLAVGSFLNVVIHRVPRAESIVWPGSRCPQCKTPIKPWQNIPVISYLFLHGRCKTCGWPIKPRYPLVELLGGIVAVTAILIFGVTWDSLGCMLLGWHLIALGVIDFETQTVPDQIVLPMAAGGVLVGLLRGGPYALVEPLIAAAMAGLFFGLVYLIGRFILRKRDAIGSGDITMSMAFALYLTPMMLILTMLVSAVVALVATLIWAFASSVSRSKLRETPIPFGSALAVGAWSVYTFGAPVVAWLMKMAGELLQTF